MSAYYNEFDPFAAAWLRELIKAGLIAPGDVDERSIADVQPGDLDGYTQCHFFAGIGGWSYAARLAGWPDDRPIWTGSCPCQPFSVAGKGAGTDDVRHLWPDFFRLIRAARPPVVMGEQVAGKAGYGWLDGVLADLAGEDYAGRGVDIPACAVDAPHIRQRLWWIGVDGRCGVGLADARLLSRRRGPHDTFHRPLGSDGDGEGGHDGVVQDDTIGDRPLAATEPLRAGRLAADVADEPLAEPWSGGPGRGTDQPGGDDGHGHAAGRQEGPGGAADNHEAGVRQADTLSLGRGCDATRGHAGAGDAGSTDGRGVDQVDASGERRGEGRAEPELRSGRPTLAGADARGGRDVADSHVPEFRHQPSTRQLGVDEQDAGDGLRAGSRNGTFWSDCDWLLCHDGKARRTEPGAPLLAHGVPKRVAKWRGLGNAIVPALAAEVIAAFLDAEHEWIIDHAGDLRQRYEDGRRAYAEAIGRPMHSERGWA